MLDIKAQKNCSALMNYCLIQVFIWSNEFSALLQVHCKFVTNDIADILLPSATCSKYKLTMQMCIRDRQRTWVQSTESR